jgi:hypothetical protein
MKYIVEIDGVHSTRYIYNVWSVHQHCVDGLTGVASISQDIRIFESDNRGEFINFMSQLVQKLLIFR